LFVFVSSFVNAVKEFIIASILTHIEDIIPLSYVKVFVICMLMMGHVLQFVMAMSMYYQYVL
jgi:hypothetical protein